MSETASKRIHDNIFNFVTVSWLSPLIKLGSQIPLSLSVALIDPGFLRDTPQL